MKYYSNVFSKIISTENLFISFDEFKKDKQNRADVLNFEYNLETNIFNLQRELQYHTYKHDVYSRFKICDPKPRVIHKATVRDRVLHHAIFRVLNPLFEPTFIAHSFSCRINKGTHKGVDAVSKMLRQASRNNKQTCYALKCDIQKFFSSVDHQILLKIIKRKIKDPDVTWLMEEIIGSFGVAPQSQLNLFHLRTQIEREREDIVAKRGIPIGNLTSQLFANIYMNEFDQFVKHKLKINHYVRYTDDFVVVSDDIKYLENLIPTFNSYLDEKLKLKLHPNKISIRKFRQGVDFLGYVVLPRYRLLRGKTKIRITRKLKSRVIEYKEGIITEKTLEQSLNSYLGVLSHANMHNFRQELINLYWFWLSE